MYLASAFAGLFLVSGALTAATPGCHANNCARAVTGTRTGRMPDASSRSADCSSFQKVTVTPAASTVTSTATITVSNVLPAKRQNGGSGSVTVSPSSVPAYASDCSSAAAYSSACSCWGINAMTTTVATPVTTVTVTATVTTSASTSASASASACPTSETLCDDECLDLGTDPNNCGTCGNVCPSGVCLNAQCSVPGCAGSTCNSLSSCGADCFCFETADGTGFCGPSESCEPLADCTSTSDCQQGLVCATGTCCGRNVCIQGCGISLPRRELADRGNASVLYTDGWQGFKVLL